MNNMRALVIAAAFVVAVGCAGPRPYYNTQTGAVIGGGIGALAGQAVGRDTESTIIGATAGALLGSLVGNAEDQRMSQERDARQRYTVVEEQVVPLSAPDPRAGTAPGEESVRYAAPEPQIRTEPPGEWVTVDGHWEGNRWIPEHQQWRPIQP